MPTPQLASARSNYRVSQLISRRAVTEARRVRGRGVAAVAAVVATHQMAQAQTSQDAVGEMLEEQAIDVAAEAALYIPAYVTALTDLERMLGTAADDLAFDRVIDSVVTDAARAAESVAITVRPTIRHARYVSPPCCSRCAILAGRVYRWSTGFQRHPGCDCSMIPTTVGSTYALNPEELVADGQVRGLSKADMQALSDGADLGQVVNVRKKAAGLIEAGHALTRGGRPTPAGIYRIASDREQALELLKRFRYIT